LDSYETRWRRRLFRRRGERSLPDTRGIGKALWREGRANDIDEPALFTGRSFGLHDLEKLVGKLGDAPP
jgi:hypothetical protein